MRGLPMTLCLSRMDHNSSFGIHRNSSLLVGDDLHVNRALAGAVEFAEVDPLPAAEDQTALVYEDEGRAAHHALLNVRGRIVLDVAIARILARSSLVQHEQHVML